MNVFILVMLILSFLGLIDKMLNNKLGLEKAFDKGIQTMGTLALSMLGFYCIAVTLVGHHVDSITAFSQSLHIDPSIFISCLLAPDLGGFSIIHALTSHQGMLVLAGLVITSTIGTVISFQLPLFLTALEKDDISSFINGLIYGMIVMPCVFIPVGMILEIDHIFMILLPVFLICLILVAGLLFLQKTTMSFLLKFGEMIRILSLLFFLLVIVTCYCDHFHFTSMTLIQEGLMIV
ncbi:MAG: ethanolamine utilization protein EutH, partial [Faecalibacillus sp.]